MKFNIIGENTYEIYLNNLYLDVKTFDDKDNIYDVLKSILEKIMKYYNIKFNGLYNMDIYIDNNLGTIIKVEMIRDFEYLKSVDLKLRIYKDYNFKIEIIDKDLLLTKDINKYNPIQITEKINFTI